MYGRHIFGNIPVVTLFVKGVEAVVGTLFKND